MMKTRKKLSLKGLAKFMTASDARRLKVLHDFKYPDAAEGMAMRTYYREARNAVALHHREQRGADWLRARAQQLESRAAGAAAGKQRELRSNARAIRAYARNFADRQFEVLADLDLSLDYGDVVITVKPDLHVRERNKEKLVKLEFSSTVMKPEAHKILAQGLFEAAQAAGMELGSSQVLLLDVPRGDEHRGARMGARRRHDIEAACSTIATLWPSI